jgi:hypothetical protein
VAVDLVADTIRGGLADLSTLLRGPSTNQLL